MRFNAKISKAGRGLGGGTAEGPGGNCICLKCGYKTKHITGEQCYKKVCPKCGAKMTRE